MGSSSSSSYMSEDAQSLITGLLTRDPNQRLGHGDSGSADIRAHPFFASIDFTALEARQLTPPFVPDIKGDGDLRNIDPAFTQENAVDSYVDSNLKDDTSFQGFTYVDGGAM